MTSPDGINGRSIQTLRGKRLEAIEIQASSRLSKHKITDFQTKTEQDNTIPFPHGLQLYLFLFIYFFFFEKNLQGKNLCLNPEFDKQSKCFGEIFNVRLRLPKI